MNATMEWVGLVMIATYLVVWLALAMGRLAR
jgi:hypothetical protein